MRVALCSGDREALAKKVPYYLSVIEMEGKMIAMVIPSQKSCLIVLPGTPTLS